MQGCHSPISWDAWHMAGPELNCSVLTVLLSLLHHKAPILYPFGVLTVTFVKNSVPTNLKSLAGSQGWNGRPVDWFMHSTSCKVLAVQGDELEQKDRTWPSIASLLYP